MNDIFNLTRADAPLLISIPHLGTRIPNDLRHLYTDIALTVADTDWHLDRLYECAHDLGATVLSARQRLTSCRHSRQSQRSQKIFTLPPPAEATVVSRN